MSTASISAATPKALPTIPASTTNAAPAKHKRDSAHAGAPGVSSGAKTANAPVSGAAAALKEGSETSAQTAKAAAGSDREAQASSVKTATEATARSGATSGTQIDVKA